MHTIVSPTSMMYIAVDGVAPMAKIKQQRTRRFKSAANAEEEARIRAQALGIPYVKQPRFDTNAITPGTKFMEKLSAALRAYAKPHAKKIVVSPADEEGEGEQKIMDFLRKNHNQYKDAVIYGLDADLIVLSLCAFAKQGITVDLFREEVEMNGQVKAETNGQESFLYLNCEILGTELYNTYSKPNQTKQQFLIDFVALMSILGNDFVPHGMSLKIRDEGIEKLLHIYKYELNHDLLLNNTYNRNALLTLFKAIHEKESQWILKGIKAKLTSRSFCQSRDLADIAVSKLNDLPIVWAKELCLVDKIEQEDAKPRYELKPNWQNIYDKEALWGADPEKAAKVYLEALTWTFAYYCGEKVDTYWFYPWPLPPRSETILKVIESSNSIQPPLTKREPIKPLEQLAMVLPQSSFTLLPPEYLALITNNPYAWPTAWASYSLGRRFLWECEPLIPLIRPDQIKQWIETLYEGG